MIKIEDVQKICTGLAWGRDVNLLVDTFEVNVELPFPLYDALQREIVQAAGTYIDGLGRLPSDYFTQPFKVIDLTFPNNITTHIRQSDRVVFEVVEKTPAKVIPIDNGSFLKPGGDRA